MEQILPSTDTIRNAMPDMSGMTEKVPKVISPAVHGALDYSVAATFFALGMRLSSTHRRASTLAFINGAMVLGLALLTDYPAGVFRKVSFKTHRTADIMQAALAGLGPVAMGFANDPEATYFYGQAASEVGVIMATDWDAQPTRGAVI
jgi:hypothetical protein